MTGEELPPLTMYNVAMLLRQAGETGITTTQLARATSWGPRDWMSQSNRCNQFLRKLERYGASRPGDKEPQPDQYRNMPVRRWYAVAPGIDIYLEGGPRKTKTAARQARRAKAQLEAQARREQQVELLAAYRKTCGPRTAQCKRERVVVVLRTAGASLQAVGSVFCLTRERVRQIQLGEKHPCTCLWCEASRGGVYSTRHQRRVVRKIQ